MAETERKDTLPLDTHFLSNAIIELNISRHNVSIYPQNHPIVEKSLNRAFILMEKLFELRDTITIATAKKNLIIDNCSLGTQNPVFKQFAACLATMNIVHVTFVRGMTKDELYSFHMFLLSNEKDRSSEYMMELFNTFNLTHIKAGFVDYSAFDVVEETKDQSTSEGSLLEQYLSSVLNGDGGSQQQTNMVYDAPPAKLASLINQLSKESMEEESYERVITSYIQKSSDKTFASGDLKRITEFIDNLRPELKQQFLSSTVNTISREPNMVEKSLSDMSADEVINLLSLINEQTISVPDTLKNILGKFSGLTEDYHEASRHGGEFIEDDIFLSSEVMNILGEDNFRSYVSDSYQAEIQRFTSSRAHKTGGKILKEIEMQLLDEHIERNFNQIILELLKCNDENIMSGEDFAYLIGIVRQQTDQFLSTGMYKQILVTVLTLKSSSMQNSYPETISATLSYFYSPEFMTSLLASFRTMGRDMREEAIHLCEHFGEEIMPYLIEALVNEKSQTLRRFIISLISSLGEKAYLEVAKRLDDNRWYVKRNMLYILNQCSSREVLLRARPYCNHENPKVSSEAVKCLLKAGDSYGVKSLRDYLKSKSGERVRKAISMSGAYKVEEIVPDLIGLLKKTALKRADYELKIPIVKALGQIGDPRALDTLRKLLAGNSLLFRASSRKLKDEIRKTLKLYPEEKVGDLIEK